MITRVNIISEYLPDKGRSFIFTVFSGCYSLSNVFFLLIYKFLKPDTNENIFFSALLYNGFIILFLIICYIILLEDSPRNLLIQNDLEKANLIIEIIYKKKFTLDKIKAIQKDLMDKGENNLFIGKEIRLKMIFHKKIRRIMILNTILIFLFNFSIIGINIVLPQLFEKIIEEKNLNKIINKNQSIDQLILFTLFDCLIIIATTLFIELQLFSKKVSKIIILTISKIFKLIGIIFPSYYYIFSSFSNYMLELCFILLFSYSVQFIRSVIKDYVWIFRNFFVAWWTI